MPLIAMAPTMRVGRRLLVSTQRLLALLGLGEAVTVAGAADEEPGPVGRRASAADVSRHRWRVTSWHGSTPRRHPAMRGSRGASPARAAS